MQTYLLISMFLTFVCACVCVCVCVCVCLFVRNQTKRDETANNRKKKEKSIEISFGRKLRKQKERETFTFFIQFWFNNHKQRRLLPCSYGASSICSNKYFDSLNAYFPLLFCFSVCTF